MLKYTKVYLSIQVICVSATTIKLQNQTKDELDQYREYKNESYDEVINKLLFVAKTARKDPELSKQTIIAIEQARERIRTGRYVNEEQARKRLGITSVQSHL
jgi:hypothetical protein